MPDKVNGASAKNVKLWLVTNSDKLGLKQDEIAWSGVLDWLDLRGKAKVTREQVGDYLSGKGVAVSSKTLAPAGAGDLPSGWSVQENPEYGPSRYPGRWNYEFVVVTDEGEYVGAGASPEEAVQDARDGYPEAMPDGAARYSSWWGASFKDGIPGTYREILVTLPENRRAQTYAEWVADGRVGEWSTKGVSSAKSVFRSDHFDERNILVHIRADEVNGADGKRYLRVGEIQSDWGQKGRREGFKGQRPTDAEVRAYFGLKDGADPAEYRDEMAAGVAKKGAPSAPFVTDTASWVALGVKQALRHAIDVGADGVVFGTGRQNAKLYALSKTVNGVSWRTRKGTKRATLELGNGDQLTFHLDSAGIVTSTEGTGETRYNGEGIDGIVGKGLAEKIMADEEGVISGEGLDIGGEGMKTFYDRIVPSVVNDVLRKLGGGKLGTVDAAGTTQPGFTISPSLRERALNSGIPLFSKRRDMAILEAQTRGLPTLLSSREQSAADRLFGQVHDEMLRELRQNGAIPPDLTHVPMTAAPAVLQMLGVPNQMVAVHANILDKIHLWKHDKDMGAVSPTEMNRMLRDPALVFKHKNGDFELVTDVAGESGPITMVVKPNADVDGVRYTALKSAYSRRDVVARIKEGLGQGGDRKLVYANMGKVPGVYSAIWPTNARVADTSSEGSRTNSKGSQGRFDGIEGGLKERRVKEWLDLVKFIANRYGGPRELHPSFSPRRQSGNLDDIYAEAARQKPDFDAAITEIADVLGVRAVIPNTLKGRERAEAKITADYLGDASKIKDVLRAALVVDSLAEADAAMGALAEVFPVHSRKSGFGPQTPIDGYRDGRVVVWAGDVTAEVQVLLHGMNAVKGAVHALYAERQGIERKKAVEDRAFTPRELARVTQLNARMVERFQPAWERATMSRKSPSVVGYPLRQRLSYLKGRWSGSNAKQSSPPSEVGMVATGMSSTSKNLVPAGNDSGSGMGDSLKMSNRRHNVRGAQAGGFDIPDGNLWRTFVHNFQDRFDSLSRAEKQPHAGAAQPYREETLYHGRVGALVEDFDAEHVKPLLQGIHGAELTLDEVGTYLLARHAPEANRRLKAINPGRPNNDDLSGMSDADAAQTLADFTAAGKLPALQGIAKRVDAITKLRRDLLVSADLEDAGTVRAWENAYKFYVPLFREEMDTRMPTKGRGFDTRGKSKRRAGSHRAVDTENLLARIVAAHESTIIRAEKAEVAREMLRFALDNPAPHLWEVNPVDYAPRFDANGLVTFAQDPSYALADNVLAVREGGKQYHISFNTENVHAMRIVSSLKNLTADQGNALIRAMSRFNRYLSTINTSLNPEFTVVNFLRDLQTAGYNLTATEANGLRGKVLGNVGSAWRGINSAELGGGAHPWAKHYRAFRDAGAKTGWLQSYEDINDRRANLEHELWRMKKGASQAVVNGLMAVVDFVEKENVAIENGVRLSAFVHSRELFMRQGQTADEATKNAARLAKELTVNFNRKGEYGTWMNALYLFYNASIQGTTTLLKTVAKSHTAQALVAATTAAAFGLELLNQALSDRDDDDELYYDKLRDNVKDRNLIIMLPNTGGKYLKVPLPWGYNVFHVLGQETARASFDPHYDAVEGAARFGAAVVDAFSPVSQGGSATQWLTPTIADPVVMMGENRNAFGNPMYPEDTFSKYPTPLAYQHFSNARPASVWLADKLNRATGGDEYEKGVLDTAPAFLDLLWDTGTGGLGRFVADTASLPFRAAQGDVETRTVPFLRKVYGEPDSKRGTMTYMDNRLRLAKVNDILDHGSAEQQAEARKKYPAEVQVVESGDYKFAESYLRKVRGWIKQVEAEPDTPARAAELKSLKEEEMATRVALNKAMNAARK